jgi:predicted nuclease of predicted toxin-antitoxin system
VTLRLLLDEHISPSLTARLAEIGVFAQAVAHVGLSGQPDRNIWAFALQNDMAVVTTNATDFLDLMDDAELYPGLILLRESGLSRQQQWEHLEPAVHFIQAQQDADFLLNKVIDILSPGEFRVLATSES